jgi:hypothetical protein
MPILYSYASVATSGEGFNYVENPGITSIPVEITFSDGSTASGGLFARGGIEGNAGGISLTNMKPQKVAITISEYRTPAVTPTP